MRKIIVEIDGTRFEAAMHTEKAPRTCEAISKIFPIETEVTHSRFSGESMWFNIDAAENLDYENHTSYLSRGDMLYYPGSIHKHGILIAYGGATFSSKVGLLAGSHFASIVGDLDLLGEMGMKLIRQGAKTIKIISPD